MAQLETDPVSFALDANGDIEIPWRWVRGREAVAQSIRCRLRLFRGEWFLDQSIGVPYLKNDQVPQAQAILGRRFNATSTRAEIRAAILGAPGVLEITSLEVAFVIATRALTITANVSTLFGDTVIQEG